VTDVDVGLAVGVVFGLFLYFWPVLVIAAIIVGGVLLGCVIVAVVGAVRAGINRDGAAADTSSTVDVEEFFAEQPAVPSTGRNDSI
jgi:hypothetical protein